jgi:phospholipid/cholesterol/gamma-HCH transport system substrate-binding protein
MRIQAWAIGIFLLVGFALFTAILFLVGNRHKAFSRHIEVYTEFSNLGGLANGAKVRVSGLDAGQIKRIEIPQSPSGRFRLQLQLEEKVRGMVRRDSVASIDTEGVVGDKFVSLHKGTEQAGEVAPGTTLPSKEPLDLSALLDKSSGLLNEVNGGIKDIRSRANVALETITKTVNHADTMITGLQPQVSKIAADGSQITNNVNLLVAGIQRGEGPAGLLLKNEATKQQLQATLTDVKQTTANLHEASTQIDQILADFRARDLFSPAEVTLENAQQLSHQLNTTLQEALAEDNLGENGASNLRSTLSNLNRSTANLAEDTEALKHNFFFRGFFKKRGYYNLEQLTPNDYLANDLQKGAGNRQWLTAQNLFETTNDGAEQLSAAGRQQIDNAVAPLVDTLPVHPVIVEGYAVQGSASQQFVASRRRAEMVRRYLETHYHLNHKNLGIVPLRDKPPENTGKTNWDGAAIVVIGTGHSTK